MRHENDIKNQYSVLLRRGFPLRERDPRVLKRKRKSLRELHLPEVDRCSMLSTNIHTPAVHEAFLVGKRAQLIGSPGSARSVAELRPIDRVPGHSRSRACAHEPPVGGDVLLEDGLESNGDLVEASWSIAAKRREVTWPRCIKCVLGDG